MHLILLYLGIFVGIFLEGEMIMISSVIAAHHGHLNIWIVIAIGIVGTYLSDCFYFFLGRKKGKTWVDKKEKLKKKHEIVDRQLEKTPILIFLSYRFLYGFRSITPLIIGTSSTSTPRFLILSGLSIVFWATVYSALGYLFGEIIKSQLGHFEHIEKYIIAILVLVALCIFVYKSIKKCRKDQLIEED